MRTLLCCDSGLTEVIILQPVHKKLVLIVFSYQLAAKAHACLHIDKASPEPLLFAHMKYGSRERLKPKCELLPSLITPPWAIKGGFCVCAVHSHNHGFPSITKKTQQCAQYISFFHYIAFE